MDGYQTHDKPDSVLPRSRHNNRHRGSEHNQSASDVTTGRQAFYPPPGWDTLSGGLFEVAAHRDCPFHSNLIASSLLL